MTTLFTRIIEGELPARFVWRDERAVAFLPIAPLCPGHTLVVPIEPVDHWIDLDDDLNTHVWTVAKVIGRALDEAFQPTKVGVIVQGVEVPHAHVHVVPYTDLSQMTFASQDMDPDPDEMDRQMELIRATLRAHGRGAQVPD